MQLIKYVYLTLAFLLELVMFFSFSYWGFQKGQSLISKWSLAILFLAVSITLWAIFAAPKATTRLDFPLRLIFELSMFLLAAFALYKLNYSTVALLYAILAILSIAIALVFKL